MVRHLIKFLLGKSFLCNALRILSEVKNSFPKCSPFENYHLTKTSDNLNVLNHPLITGSKRHLLFTKIESQKHNGIVFLSNEEVHCYKYEISQHLLNESPLPGQFRKQNFKDLCQPLMDYILQSNLLIEVNMWSFSALLWCWCYFASKGQESIQIDFTQETCISICLNPLQICSTLKTALIYSLSY